MGNKWRQNTTKNVLPIIKHRFLMKKTKNISKKQMKNLKDKIQKLNEKYFSEIVEFRRHIHQYPELSFKEFETAKYIKSILTKYNIEFDESFGENAVIGIIKGDLSGDNIALRADMDALPIEELVDSEFKSKVPGLCTLADTTHMWLRCWGQQ